MAQIYKLRKRERFVLARDLERAKENIEDGSLAECPELEDIWDCINCQKAFKGILKIQLDKEKESYRCPCFLIKTNKDRRDVVKRLEEIIEKLRR